MSQLTSSTPISNNGSSNGSSSASTPEVNYSALMKKAMLELRETKARLNALEERAHEAIAIVGMGCRFPGGVTSPESFWQLLSQGVDAITEVPSNRWNIDDLYDPDPTALGKIITRYGGFIDEIETFDASFFGISPREAHSLDPQQRLLLEVSWEALEAAHCPPETLFNTPVGVFIGICNNDYGNRLGTIELPEAYWGTGNALSVAAGRLSYALGLTGPSLAVDTACSSSLVSVHLACQSLRQGECQVALAGGVNLLLSPGQSMIFSQAGMLAPDGRCKTFDANANGYVRGEGCGIIVLKRLSDAIADQDNILATIRGSAINQDGPSGALTVPNGPSQQTVIRQALKQGRVQPQQVSYIEAHGTGTSLGDPIEVEALGSVFADRAAEHPLLIGSAKTNIGHLEGAAGIAGLVKVVLQLQHRQIPPHLHFSEPNPFINWAGLPVQVVADGTDWQPNHETRIAGVSSFGFGGTNCHIVLEEAVLEETVLKESAHADRTARPLHIFTLSAKSPRALKSLVSLYQTYVSQGDVDLASLCALTHTGRNHFNHRLAILAHKQADLQQTLEALQDSDTVDAWEDLGAIAGHVKGNRIPKVAFLFTGQGAQYINMGRELYQTEPLFRQVLDHCAQGLSDLLDVPLLDLLYPDLAQNSNPESNNNGHGSQLDPLDPSERIHQTAYAQPCLFAVEYALAQLWLSWGIKPSLMMGHSVGEYVAATLAGVFSLEDGLRLIAARGQLMQSLPSGGGMLSALTSPATLEPYLAAYRAATGEPTLAIAAINGPQSTVISGPIAALTPLAEQLSQADIKVKPLSVSHGFHSPLMEPILEKFKAIAQQITYHPPSQMLVSNLTGTLADSSIASAAYWTNHIRQPVQFVQGIEKLAQANIDTFIEIGPKPVLLGMARQFMTADTYTWLPSLHPALHSKASEKTGAEKSGAEYSALFNSLARLHVLGYPISWQQFTPQPKALPRPLPTYPFQRQRFWVDPAPVQLQQRSLKLTESSPEQTGQHLTEDLEALEQTDVKTFPLLQQLNPVPVAHRAEVLATALRAQVAKVLRIDTPAEVDMYQSLTELGLDSLMGVEFKNRLESALNLSLPTTILFKYPDIASLSEHLVSEFLSAEPLLFELTESTAASSNAIPLADRSQPLPLSYAQQRMWVLAQLEALDAAYHLPVALRLTGALDNTALEQALALIVARHESLRTIFVVGAKGEPTQQIQPEMPVDLPITDLQDLAPAAQTQVIEWLSVENNDAFELTSGPLFRLHLICLSPQEHILLLNFHHIIFDGWSSGVLIQEFRQAYGALVQGQTPQLPAIAIQYADFVQWQRQQLQGDVLSQHLTYWQQQLADAPPLLELPTDRPRPAVQSAHGAIFNQSLPALLSQEVRQFSQASGKTLFMTLLTGFVILLHRYSGQTDISVGSPIANRPHHQVEGLIGLFLNTLVLRSDLSGDPTVADMLERVERTAIGAYEHQDVPFEYLIDQLKPERHLDHSLWFQVMFILQNTPQQSLGAADVEMSYLEMQKTVAKFDITLSVEELDSGLQVEWEYNTDLFDEGTIERMARHYEVILGAMVQHPQQPIAKLPLLSVQEQASLLAAAAPSVNNFADQTIHSLVERQVTQSADAIAVQGEHSNLTYGQLNAQANQLAHYLVELGVTPDTLVGLCVDRSPQMVVAVLGILKAGAAYVPLDPTYPSERLDYIIADAGIERVVTTAELQLAVSSLSRVARRICLDEHSAIIAQQPVHNLAIALNSNSLAYAIYTSGSTGKPKGVLIEHYSLVNFVQGAIATYGFESQDRVLQFASLSFDTAAEEIYPTLAVGAALVLRNEATASGLTALWQQCQAWQLTVLDLPTAYWQQLVAQLARERRREGDRSPSPLPANLRLIIIGGEKVSVESVRLWQQLMQDQPSAPRLLNTYGPTETTVVATLYEIPHDSLDEDDENRLNKLAQEIPIGKPLPNVLAYVLDAHHQLVPTGVPGELYLGGPGVARGYLNQPERTAESFIDSPFGEQAPGRLYKTGDRVKSLADGNLAYLGRFDHQVKIRGFRIELGEIEATMVRHSAIEESIVIIQEISQEINREDQPSQTLLVGYGLLHPGQMIEPAAIKTYLKAHLPHYMVPDVVMLLEHLPLTANGKVDRRSLPIPQDSDRLQGRIYVPPRTETEAVLVDIMADVLSLELVGVNDNFFEMGGHSLLATQVIARIREQFHVEIALRSLFEQPTVAVLAEQLEQQQLTQASAEDLDALLSELDALSDEDVAQMLI